MRIVEVGDSEGCREAEEDCEWPGEALRLGWVVAEMGTGVE